MIDDIHVGLSTEPLMDLSIDAFLGFMVFLAIIMGILYWRIGYVEKKRREAFIERFDSSNLRLSKYNKSIVYRIVECSGDELKIVPVWNGNSPVSNGKEYKGDADHFAPFDRSLFIAGR